MKEIKLYNGRIISTMLLIMVHQYVTWKTESLSGQNNSCTKNGDRISQVIEDHDSKCHP